jgi:CDP-4-dehydro-6-deoxyglucose reductase
MSTYIHDSLEVGDVVKVNGPYGTFIGDPTSERPIICLAQGSGLAPIMSLSLAAMLRGGMRNPVTVYFSAKTEDDVFERGVFKYLEKKFRNFKFKYTLTGEINAEGYSGRIQKILPEIYTDLSGYDFYIAGSQDFVSECKKKIIVLNGKEERVFLEGFVKN